MTEEKILLKHPHGKHMPRIDRKKYEVIKKTMLSVLKNKELSHTELFEMLHTRLHKTFEGSVSWYAEGVKLDLEARNILERTQSKPQKYRLRRTIKTLNV